MQIVMDSATKNTINSAIKGFGRWLLDQLVPPSCLLCQARHSAEIALICDPCRSDLPHITHSCQQCGLPLTTEKTSHCGQCLSSPPAFDRSVIPLNYCSPINNLITGFKYRNKFISGRLLSQILLSQIRASYQDQPLPDLLLPVPLHWRRQFRRGYNQSQCIARYLAAELKIPSQLRRIQRRRRTPSQQGLKRQQRQRNLKGAFQVHRPLQGECVALIDDVVTTGSTCNEISRELKRAGASEVHIWALARTQLP